PASALANADRGVGPAGAHIRIFQLPFQEFAIEGLGLAQIAGVELYVNEWIGHRRLLTLRTASDPSLRLGRLQRICDNLVLHVVFGLARGVLSVADELARGAFRLVDLAFSAKLIIAGHFAGSILHRA